MAPAIPTKTAAPGEIEVAVAGDASLVHASTTRSVSRMRRSLADYEQGIHHYPEPIRTHVRWLQGYWLDGCKGNDASLRSIAIKAGWDKSEEYYYNLIGGYYFKSKATTWVEGGKAWSEFLEIYGAIRRYAEKAAEQGRIEFVETPTYRCLRDFIDGKRALNAVCKFGGILHATGAQSTACLKHYALLNNHGAVIRVEAPAVPRPSLLKRKIVRKYNVKGYKLMYQANLDQELLENVNETRTIIIDNAQRLYIDGKGSDQPLFNVLIELQEDTGCTIILNFTTDFADKLSAGRAKDYFEQFIGRMGGMSGILTLPDYAPDSDLRVIARAFGVEGVTAAELVQKWSRQPGRIRIVFDRLQRAQEIVRAEGRDRITLADLKEADKYTPPAIGTDTEEAEAA